jgi:hypothetical protein
MNIANFVNICSLLNSQEKYFKLDFRTILYKSYIYKDNPLQLIYVNSLDMHISCIGTQSVNITSVYNQHNQDSINRSALEPLSFN